jgi:hypothetical protein
MVSLGLVRLLGLLYSAAVRELSAPAVVAESLNWGSDADQRVRRVTRRCDD